VLVVKGLVFALLVLLACPLLASAQSCAPPHPFDHTSSIRGNAAFVAGSGSTCDLAATVDAANSVPSGAFAWYSLPYAAPVWRISFRIDASAFPDDGQPSSIDILAASSRQPWPASGGTSTLLRLDLFRLPGLGPLPAISAFYACNASNCATVGYTDSTLVATDIVNGDLFRFELTSAAGAAGRLRWWRNADFSDPPTGESEALDNAAWAGVQHVALGAFSPYYLVADVGGTVTFSDVDSPYDTLFWSDFDE
jgi:hypothetical protein